MATLYDWEVEVRGVTASIRVQAFDENEAVAKAKLVADQSLKTSQTLGATQPMTTENLHHDDYRVRCLGTAVGA